MRVVAVEPGAFFEGDLDKNGIQSKVRAYASKADRIIRRRLISSRAPTYHSPGTSPVHGGET
jgi:hypothetical protein